MPSTPISTLTLPDGNTYGFKDSNAIYEIPMAGANTLGGVKISATGNITIDANGYISAAGGITDVTLDGISVVSGSTAVLISATLIASDDGNGNVTLGLTGIGSLSTASGESF